MTVDKPIFPPSMTDWPWRTAHPGAAEGRSLASEPPISADCDDELAMPLVSPPLIIPRIYPGL